MSRFVSVLVPAFVGIALATLFSTVTAQESQPAVKNPEVPGKKFHEFNPVIPTEFSGKMIEVKSADGKVVHVYASGAVDSKKQILLIHEWWGLNAHVKGMADQFAKLGYRAYAIDMYDGKSATDAETAQKLMTAAMEDKAGCQARLDTVVAHSVKENADAKLATVGWCFGGGWSLRAAVANKDVDAAVVYYGLLIDDPKSLETLKAPVLGIFADKDEWITLEQVEGFKKAMTAAKKSLQCEIFAADHAFANPSGKRYQEKEARDAWSKMMTFFEKHLK